MEEQNQEQKKCPRCQYKMHKSYTKVNRWDCINCGYKEEQKKL